MARSRASSTKTRRTVQILKGKGLSVRFSVAKARKVTPAKRGSRPASPKAKLRRVVVIEASPLATTQGAKKAKNRAVASYGKINKQSIKARHRAKAQARRSKGMSYVEKVEDITARNLLKKPNTPSETARWNGRASAQWSGKRSGGIRGKGKGKRREKFGAREDLSDNNFVRGLSFSDVGELLCRGIKPWDEEYDAMTNSQLLRMLQEPRKA
jgi:hypothetical protein